MCLRATLHRLVDSLPEEDLTTAGRLLMGLTATADFSRDALIFAIRTAFVVGRPRFGWDGLVF